MSDYRKLITHCKIAAKYYAFFRGCFKSPEEFNDTFPDAMLRQDDIFLSLAYDFQLRAIRKWVRAFCDMNSDIYYKKVLSDQQLVKCEVEYHRIFDGKKAFDSALKEIANLASVTVNQPSGYEALLYNFNFYKYLCVADATTDICQSKTFTIQKHFSYNSAHDFIKTLRVT